MRRIWLGTALVLLATSVPAAGGMVPRAGATTLSPLTALFADSEAGPLPSDGDSVGGGSQQLFTSPATTFATSGSSPSDIYVTTSAGVNVEFRAPAGQTFTTGAYSSATRGQIISSWHMGCSQSRDYFTILDISFSGGVLQSFSAIFEQHCFYGTSAFMGQVSYNSTAPFRSRTISPDPGSFDGIQYGTTSAPQTFTVTNHGPSPDTITTVGIIDPVDGYGNPKDFSVTSNTCAGTTLASGSSCTIVADFHPSVAVNRIETADIVFFDDLALATGEGRTIGLHGTITAGVLMFSTVAPFGPVRVGTLAVQSTTVTNAGNAPFTITDIRTTQGNFSDFPGITDCYNVSIPPNGTCHVEIGFYPTHYGVRSTALQVFNNGASSPANLTLSGMGTEGYFLTEADGQVAAFGDALSNLGDASSLQLNAPIVGTAATVDGDGYWLLGRDGGIFAFGDAGFFGSTGAMRLNAPIISMAPTPSGNGYWLVASDGGIFAFGDAGFYGSTGSMHLNKPIVGMAASASGRGYWLVSSDGGIFAFGDAGFYGSTGSMHLNKPIVGMAATATGLGYWLVSTDGGIFSFGDAGFYGSTGAMVLNSPIVGMTASPTDSGYWFVAADGGIFAFGDSAFLGSLGGAGVDDVIAMSGTAPAVAPPARTLTGLRVPTAGRAWRPITNG